MEKNKLSAVIVDDEQEAIDYLCNLLEEHNEISLLGKYIDPVISIGEIIKSKPDILFLDIEMPHYTGFDLIKEVRSDIYTPYVIFTTGYTKYAIRALKNAAFDYLLKPINPFELEAAILKLTISNEQYLKVQKFDELFSELEDSKPIKFNTSSGFTIIQPSDIIYLEASRNYCEIHQRNNRMELVTVNMLQVFNMLPKNYYRISRSHVINLEHLQKVDRRKKICYILVDGKTITLPIPPGNIKELECIFDKFS